jgi:hypothetical protein
MGGEKRTPWESWTADDGRRVWEAWKLAERVFEFQARRTHRRLFFLLALLAVLSIAFLIRDGSNGVQAVEDGLQENGELMIVMGYLYSVLSLLVVLITLWRYKAWLPFLNTRTRWELDSRLKLAPEEDHNADVWLEVMNLAARSTRIRKSMRFWYILSGAFGGLALLLFLGGGLALRAA